MSGPPDIRVLDAEGVAQAVEWAAREGWNPGLSDAAAFLGQDGEGFIGLFADGELAATLSAVRYEGGFGFIGFYICRPELRGRGLGLALWRAGMARLAGRVVGLDGVLAQEENYQRSGFVLAHRNIRFGGPAPDGGAADPRVRTIDGELMRAVEDFDRRHFGYPRPGFLQAWLAPPSGRAVALLEDGEIRACGVVRRCRQGFKVGPLFADGPPAARTVFDALAAHARGEAIFLDVPEPNIEARALAEAAGLAPVFATARMYRGPAPPLPLGRIFGITSFELG